MRIFLICSVRGASPETLAAQERYVAKLEAQGHKVHYPPRDTKQDACGLEICQQNLAAVDAADEVHVWYIPESQGTHFDMGMAFALGKPVRTANCPYYEPGKKSYAMMLSEWEFGR